MGRLRVQTFGGLRVSTAQRQVLPLPARKVQGLFAYLAQEPGRPQPRGKLATLLWGDSPEAQARASLRQALLVLRRALDLSESELVVGSGDSVMLDPSCVEVDALELEALIDEGGVAALQRAASLYAGDFLEALDTREPAFEDWLQARRHRLRERALDGLGRLLALQVEAGEDARATEVAMRLLALDPLQEPVHRTLMQLYARQGRAASALRQFQLCRGVLSRELGTRPEPQTVALRDAIERERRMPAETAGDSGAATELRLVSVAAVAPAGTEDVDPERALVARDRLAADAAGIVGSFGGTLECRVDGTLCALFGLASARGDELQRAARCALRLRELDGALRGGLAGGVAIVMRSGGTPSLAGSDAVARALRLAAAAAPGQVLVSDATWRALSPLAEGLRCHESALPAALRSTGAWQLGALRAAPPSHAALVGRRAEVAQFEASLQGCRERGGGLVMHLRGEAGIGKTRLVEHFREIAVARGFGCHGGAMLDFGAWRERDPIRAVVGGLIGAGADEDGASEDKAIARAIAEGLVEVPREVHLHELLQRPPPPPLRILRDAMDAGAREQGERELLRTLLQRCCSRAPLLLVVEDLHWAPPRTLAQVAVLAAAAEECRALLVTTARSEGDPLDAAWRSAAGISAFVTLDLGPLRWSEASALAAQYADTADPFTLRCIERAGGNPLFLEQLLGAGRDAAAALPHSVLSVVQARLDALSPPERHALRVASVLGQRFALAALEHLLAGTPWDARATGGLLRVESSEAAFAHALVREGAYASLPGAQRSELHARAAQWFAGRDAVMHAEHLDRAGDAGAAKAWLEAARQEAASQRQERAMALAERGLALAPTGETHFGLASCRAELLHDLGATPDAQVAWEAALAAAEDEVQRCRAWIGLAAVLRVRDDLERATKALEQAEGVATACGLRAERARIHLLRGNLLFPRGELEACRREHERSLALAREAGSVELEVAALGGLGDADFLRGRMLDAGERFAACVALAQRHGLKRVEAANRPMAAITRWLAGDTRDALAQARAAIETAAQIGHHRAEAIARHGAYQSSHALGEFEEACGHAERALELARQIGAPRFEAEALAFRGEVLACMGRRADATADLQQAVAIARSTGMSYMGPVFLAMLALACDDAREREAALAEGEALLATNRLAHNHLLFRRDAIDACLASSDHAGVRRHADALDRFTREQPLPWSNFFVARARALITGERDALRSVRHEGERQGQLVALARIRQALGE